MCRLKSNTLVICIAVVLLALLSHAAFGAAAKMQKSVTQMEDGKYLIKITVTASNSSIFALKLIDPQASILDVYAPRGWCIVSDGEDFLARTSETPIRPGKSIEFIIHSSTDDIHYTWAVFGMIKQLGQPGAL